MIIIEDMGEENKEKELADKIHMLIHSVRLLPNYKPTEFEKRVSKIVLEHFKDCSECKEVKAKIENQPKQKGFLSRLGELADGA